MARPMAEWVMRMLPEPVEPAEPQQPGDGAVGELLDEFARSPQHAELTRAWTSAEDARSIGEMLIQFAVSGGTGDPLEWSPRGVDEFFDWWTDNVVAPDLEMEVPPVTEAWVRFAFDRKRLAPGLVKNAMAAVAELGEKFLHGDYRQQADPDDVDFWDFSEGFDVGGISPWRAPRLDLTEDELALVVGGADALKALTADPLPDEELDWSGVSDEVRGRVGEVLALIDRGAAAYEDELQVEVRTAQRRLLARAAREAPEWFSPKSKPVGSAHAICWLVGRANDLLGPNKVLTGSELAAAVGASGSASQRAARLQRLLGMPISTSYNVLIGDPRLLIGEVREQILELRAMWADGV